MQFFRLTKDYAKQVSPGHILIHQIIAVFQCWRLSIRILTVQLEGPTVVIPGMMETRVFTLGETEITYTITDQAGNTSSCSWTVTVEDNEAPMIICIGDTILYADENCGFTETTNGLDPITSDNCVETTLVHDYLFAPNQNTLAGATFSVGSTQINWTLTDAAGNTATCSYLVTVQDTIAPAFINCPQDTLVAGNSVDDCSAFVTFSTPTGRRQL